MIEVFFLLEPFTIRSSGDDAFCIFLSILENVWSTRLVSTLHNFSKLVSRSIVSLREGEVVRELAADCGEYLVGVADRPAPIREAAPTDTDSALSNATAGNRAPFSITMGRVRLDGGRDESYSLPIATESGVVLPLDEAAFLEALAARRFAIIFSRFLSPTLFLHSTHLQFGEQYVDTRKQSQYCEEKERKWARL